MYDVRPIKRWSEGFWYDGIKELSKGWKSRKYSQTCLWRTRLLSALDYIEQIFKFQLVICYIKQHGYNELRLYNEDIWPIVSYNRVSLRKVYKQKSPFLKDSFKDKIFSGCLKTLLHVDDVTLHQSTKKILKAQQLFFEKKQDLN